MQSNSYGIKTSNDPKSFKYESFDLSSDYSISIRGISLTSHQSTRIMIIPSYGITAYQHYSDVVLQSRDTSLLRCKITCLLGLFLCLTRIVCFISSTNDCIVTCRALLFLYCWRVRLFRFFLASDDCCWVIIADESNCEGAWFELNKLDYCEADENNLDLNSTIIALISSLKLFIIAYRAFIVTGVLAI